MKTDLAQILKAYAGSAFFLAIAGEGLTVLAARYEWVKDVKLKSAQLGAFCF